MVEKLIQDFYFNLGSQRGLNWMENSNIHWFLKKQMQVFLGGQYPNLGPSDSHGLYTAKNELIIKDYKHIEK